jgi:hypothetical protein
MPDLLAAIARTIPTTPAMSRLVGLEELEVSLPFRLLASTWIYGGRQPIKGLATYQVRFNCAWYERTVITCA